MLIEQRVEATIMEAVDNALQAAGISKDTYSLQGAWQPADSTKVYTDQQAALAITVAIGTRQHDDFSLPTVNLSGTVAIKARAELCPTLEPLAQAYDALITLLGTWHANGRAFSNAVSNESFYATEIKMDGSPSVAFDQQQSVWRIEPTFTIRGTVTDIVH